MTARAKDPRGPRRAEPREVDASPGAASDDAALGGGVTRRGALQALAGGSGLLLLSCATPPQIKGRGDGYDWSKHRWGYAIDVDKCIGCGSCQRACREENKVPEGYHRTWVERYRLADKRRLAVDAATSTDHVFHKTTAKVTGEVTRAFFVPKMCNHCSGSVCTKVCPVGASFHTKDGVVLVDHDHCIGCGYCVQACPYGCRFINPRMHMADKCTWCYHRITKRGADGEFLKPACVMACPVGARFFGDLKDPHGHLTLLLKRRTYRVLRPALGTDPNCYYHGLEREVL